MRPRTVPASLAVQRGPVRPPLELLTPVPHLRLHAQSRRLQRPRLLRAHPPTQPGCPCFLQVRLRLISRSYGYPRVCQGQRKTAGRILHAVYHVPRDGKQRARQLSRRFGACTVALTVSGSTPSPMSGPLLVMAALIGALSWKANDIAKDPPRDDWWEPTVPAPRTLRLDLFPLFAYDTVDLIESLVGIEADMAAGVVALERAQGATNHGETPAAAARIDESMFFFSECAVAMPRAAVLLEELAHVGSHHSRIQVGWRPYPREGLAFARAVGLTDEEIRPFIRQRLAVVDFFDRLFATAQEMREFASFLSAWSERQGRDE
jgi:hypothetical protein